MQAITLLVVCVVSIGMPFVSVSAEEKMETEVDGTWKLIKYIETGKPNADEINANYLVVRKDGVQEITKDGKPFSKTKFAVAPSKTPKHIDFIDEKGTRIGGVYEIKGCEMRVAILGNSEKRITTRPGAVKEEGNIIAVYERVAAHAKHAPKTIDEGMVRLEKILGRNDPDDQLEWRLPTDYNFKMKPKPSEPEVLLTSKGIKVVGRPFREQESVSFDDVEQWERQVYDLAEDGKKTLTRTQRSHNVTRFSISLKAGVWFVSGAMLTNGVHGTIGKPAFSGAVRWHDDGFEFIGNEGLGKYYAAGGNLILGTSQASIRYSRDGNRLVMKQQSQGYYLASDPEGTVLTFPDFKKPIGTPFKVEYRSDPATDNPK